MKIESNEKDSQNKIWSFCEKGPKIRNVYLNNCSLKHAFQRIAQVSSLLYDYSDIRDDLTVSVFVEELPVKDVLMSLCAVAGVKPELEKNKIVFKH